MSRRKRKHQDDGDKAEIDLTPMLDVVFIMLIFFIVTASFVKESTINVNVPEDSNVPPPPPSAEDPPTILIKVDKQDNIFVDNRRVDSAAVRSLVAQKLAADPGSNVVVKAHEDSSTDTYIQIADASRSARSNISISLVPFADKSK